MGLIKISKRKDVHFEYTDGYSEVKALPGECEEATITRCSLLPGKSIKPNVYSTVEHTQVFMFLTGKGYVVTPRKGFNVKNEFAIFVPDYDTENFEIVCSTDSKTPLEYLHIVTKLNDYDKHALWNSKMRLPRFRTLDDGWSYYESFKKENDQYTGKLKTVVKTGPEVTETMISEKSLGKKIGEVQSQLKSIKGVSDVKVDTSFFWVTSVPSDPNKVSFEITVE